LGFSCEHSSTMSIFLVHYCFETLSLLPSILSLSPCRPPPPPHVNLIRHAERPHPSARARGKRLLLFSPPSSFSWFPGRRGHDVCSRTTADLVVHRCLECLLYDAYDHLLRLCHAPFTVCIACCPLYITCHALVRDA
jgi:hypothetical protein